MAGPGEAPGPEGGVPPDGEAGVAGEVSEADGAGTPMQDADASIAAVTASVVTVL